MAKTVSRARTMQDQVEVIDVDQNSAEWFDVRRGIATASRFASVLAEGEGKMRATYLAQLAGELLTGLTAETFRNEAMDRGKAMEPEARDYYGRTRFADLKPIGFIRRTVRASSAFGTDFVIGASPDSQVGPRKGLEIKTMRPDLLIELSLKGAQGFPTAHRAQLQGTMLAADWDEMDLMIFHSGMPVAPTFTVVRDESYIARLRDELEKFNYDLRQLVEKMRTMGGT
jgi:hypothetical protein